MQMDISATICFLSLFCTKTKEFAPYFSNDKSGSFFPNRRRCDCCHLLLGLVNENLQKKHLKTFLLKNKNIRFKNEVICMRVRGCTPTHVLMCKTD